MFDSDLFNKIVLLLESHLSSEKERKAFLDRVFGFETSRPDIDYSGAPREATARIIKQLVDYGEVTAGVQALSKLIDLIHDEIGIDRQGNIRQIQQQINLYLSSKDDGFRLNTSLIVTYLANLEQEIKSNQAEHIIALVASSSRHSTITQSETQDNITEENVLQLARRYEQCVIVGEGGIGKTQTLYQLILEAISARSASTDAPIPLFIRLSDWGASHTSSIESYINNEWQRYGLNNYGNPLTLLSTGRAILFADGINEINAENQETQVNKLTSLFRWIDKKEANSPRYAILTSRLGDYLYYKDTFAFALPTVEIKPLTEAQIRSIAQNYFENIDRFITSLKRVRQLDLAQNPWFLSSLIELYQDEHRLPGSQGQLFKILIERRAKREVQKNNPFWLTFKPRLLELQKKYAELVYSTSGRSYHSDSAVSFSGEQIHHYLLDEDIKAGEAIGIVVTTPSGLRFTHQRYAEYFAAVYISQHLDELTSVIREPYLSSYTWRSETERSTQSWDQSIVLLSGIVDDVDTLIAKVTEIDPWLAAMCIGSGSKVSSLTENGVVQALFQALKTKKKECYHASVQAFAQIGNNCVDDLILEVRRSEENTHDAVIQALGLIGEPRAVDTLSVMLEYEEKLETKALIIEALKLIGDRKVVSTLLRLVDEANEEYDRSDFYKQIALTLGNWQVVEAVEPLIRLREKYKGPDVDRASVQAIGMIGVVNDKVKEFLLTQLKYSGQPEAAAESLALLNIAEAVEPLFEKLHNRDGKESAAKALHHLAFSSLEDFVVQNAISENIEDRTYIAKLIGWVQEVKFLPVLKGLLQDPSSEVRATSVDSIKLFRAQTVVNFIVPMLFDLSSYVRQQAARALDELSWMKYYNPSVEEQVRYHAARGSNGDWTDIREKFAGRAAQSLLPLLKDDDGDVAHSTAVSLEQIGWNFVGTEEKAWFFSAKRDYDACVSLGEGSIPAIIHKLRTRRYGAGIQETFSPLLRLNAAHEITAFLYDALHDQQTDSRLMWGLGSALMYQWECWLDGKETIKIDQVAVLIPTILDALLGQEETAKERSEWVLRNYRSAFDFGATDVLEHYFRKKPEMILALIKNARMDSYVISWIIDKTGKMLVDSIVDIFENTGLDEELKIKCISCLGYSTENIAFETLKLQLKSVNRELRGAAINALSKHPSPQIILLLIGALDDHDVEVANEAIHRLVGIGIDAVPLLRQELKNEKANIRAGVITALGQILQYIERHRSSDYDSLF